MIRTSTSQARKLTLVEHLLLSLSVFFSRSRSHQNVTDVILSNEKTLLCLFKSWSIFVWWKQISCLWIDIYLFICWNIQVIWKKSKRTAVFPQETIPEADISFWWLETDRLIRNVTWHVSWHVRSIGTHPQEIWTEIYRIPNSTHFSTSVTTKTWSRGYSGHSSSFQWVSQSEIWLLFSFSSGSFSLEEFFPLFPFWTKISTMRKDTVWIFHKRTICWISINQQKNCNLPPWYQAQIIWQQKLWKKQLQLLLNPRLQTPAMRRYL